MNREQMHAAARPRRGLSGPHTVEEWPGVEVYYADFSVAEKFAISEEKVTSTRVARVILYGLVDANGVRMFPDADLERVRGWESDFASKLFLAISEHAGLFENKEAAEKRESEAKNG